MDCENTRALLALYEDSALGQEEQEAVRRHLKDCAACREELRKLRTPVSLSSDEDGELRERYNRRREELQRKKKLKITCAVSVLAVIALFCLWYTWPVPATRIIDMPVNNFTGTLIVATVENGRPGFEIWELSDGILRDEPAYQDLMDILDRTTFRPRLGNLLGSWYTDNGISLGGYETIHFLFSDGQDRAVFFTLDEQTLAVSSNWRYRAYSVCDRQDFQNMIELFHRYGQLKES